MPSQPRELNEAGINWGLAFNTGFTVFITLMNFSILSIYKIVKHFH
jgi:hypothetical protein